MIALLFVLLIALVLLRIPVILALALVGLVGMFSTQDVTPAFFAQRSFSSLDSFSLLALPYFILAGSLMSKGGLSEALVAMGKGLFGHWRGGLGNASVVSCVSMANVSGSSAAEAAAIGSVTIPAMKAENYQPGLAASIVAAAATIGPVIPPSMTMIIYGSMTGVSIGGLFLAGVVPGLIMATALIALIFLMSYLPAFPALAHREPWQGFRALLQHVRRSWVALLAPVLIIGGIFSGLFTATEAGVVTCLYAYLTSRYYYRSITSSDLPRIVVDAGLTTATVVGIIAMAGSIGWLLSFMEFHLLALEKIQLLSQHPQTVLMVLVGGMLLMTMFLESLAVLILFVPVLAHLGQAYGFDPLHLGVLVVIATQIGAITPPVAVLMFITGSIAEASSSETILYSIPFVLTLMAVLILLMFVPELVTWLPSRMVAG
ncbi:TRAP transporter large permease [Pseudomaricurvus alkylphenolicus]|uniref:TRAP transporter large permease subunit n=1 Tax=Pseudomaricurvus alkylphenolicus TaxID=1306991 RepID=UPI001423A1E8|nr:TRAP transporter large permease [Pseudomaricurvus alkylphenolicus]